MRARRASVTSAPVIARSAEVLRGVRELERAVDAVVVGERERVVAELGRAGGELLRQRRAVEERVGRVRVQLDVRRRTGRSGDGGTSARAIPPSWDAVFRVADAAARRERVARGERHRIRPWPTGVVNGPGEGEVLRNARAAASRS